MGIGKTGAMLVLALALVAAKPTVAAESEWRRHGADGEWVQLFWFPVGIGCAYISPILVPAEDLVIAATGGSWCAPFVVLRLSSPEGPLGRTFEGTQPDGHPVGAVEDPARDRILFFMAGWGGQSFTETTTWSLNLGPTLRWRKLETRGAPRGRPGWSVVLDPRGDRVLFYGGRTAWPRLSGDVWVLSLADLSWMPVIPHGAAPEPRAYHSAIYDPDRHRMVVYGGWSGSTPWLLGDVWELSLGKRPSWRVLKTPGESPPPRYAHAALFDPLDSRMVVFGGITTVPLEPQGFVRDTWELPLKGRMAWRQLQPGNAPPNVPAAWTGVSYDPAGDRMLVGDPAGVSALQWNRGAAPHAAAALEKSESDEGANGLLASRRSPMHPLSTADEELRLYDVSGRLVISRRAEDAGSLLAAIRTGSSPDLAPLRHGIYFARRRDRTGAVTVTRIVLLRP